MTTKPYKSRRPVRDARLETKVEPRLYEAVSNFAIDKGYTLSSAMYRILLDWEKKERRRAARKPTCQ